MTSEKVSYPFIFTGHGRLYARQLDKREECFIWFKRNVKPEERKDIMRTCPRPLAGFFFWADCFVHFGSAGDTYDVEIMSAYADDEFNEYLDGTKIPPDDFWVSEEFDEMFANSANKFAEDLERWAIEVNSIVPIAFLLGPNRASKNDPWNKWSHENLARVAFAYVNEFSENYGEILNKEYFENEDTADEIDIKGIDSMVGIMKPAKIKYIFGFILKCLLKNYLYEISAEINEKKELNWLAEMINIIYRTDGIYKPVETLTYSDSDIKGNASLIEAVMEKADKNSGNDFISKLDPYAQLAFYAAKNSSALLILEISDPVNFLKTIISKLPETRIAVIPSLIIFLANNLLEIGPAYSKKPDLTQAPIAAEIMKLSFDYENVSEEAFINSAFIYDKLNDYENMLDVSLTGAEKYPSNTAINANILYTAQKLGRKETADEYAEKSKNISMKDPLLMLNQIYNLVENGKNGEAKLMIDKYVSAGGKLTPDLLANVMYLYTVNSEDDGKRDMYLTALLNFVTGTGNDNFKTNPHLICNGTIVFNNLERYNDSETLLTAFKQNKGRMTSGLYNQAMFSAIALKDNDKIENTLNDFLKKYESSPNFFNADAYSFATASNCYAVNKNDLKTIEYLEIAKQKGFDIRYVKKEKDYEFLSGNKRFEKLFL